MIFQLCLRRTVCILELAPVATEMASCCVLSLRLGYKDELMEQLKILIEFLTTLRATALYIAQIKWQMDAFLEMILCHTQLRLFRL